MDGDQPQVRANDLSGVVERITFHDRESGFCVLRVKLRPGRDLVTVVGTTPAVARGEHIECEGYWAEDRTHGLQFKSRRLRTRQPSTPEGIRKYLASGLIILQLCR